MRKIFVTGIGTDIGKTVVSAIIVEALKADYWKPVQSGTFYSTDSDTIKRLISNEVSVIHPEAYRLKEHKSPHEAAANENIKIDPEAIVLPDSSNETLVIEGAGGVMVPLNENYFIIDLIKKFDAEVIVVIQNYLGSINHSLLTIDALKHRGIKITGLVFNGSPHAPSKEIILRYSQLSFIAWITKENEIDKTVISKYKNDFENI
ncbi:MAG: dethiobiotin synthase [Bacteroidetes bacterium]|nr:MAG: dethiobiotin synthase [Bacteroidota bacterium]